MKISVITACLNSDKTIDYCIKSVARQKKVDVEHIVVDGGSSDLTLQKVRQSASVNIVIVEPNRGIYKALNRGLEVATGTFVFFLHSDDELVGDFVLYSLSRAAGSRTNVIVGGGVRWDSNSLSSRRRYSRPDHFRKWMIFFGFQPPHTATITPMSIFRKLRGFNESYLSAGDFDFFVRAFCVLHVEFVAVDRVVTVMRRGGTSDQGWQSYWRTTSEVSRALKESGFFANRVLLLFRLPVKWISRNISWFQ